MALPPRCSVPFSSNAELGLVCAETGLVPGPGR
jgi:hypothetical protein